MEEDKIKDLCNAFLLCKTEKEAYSFLKDLCTPQEINSLAERWRVCQLLDQGKMSYREIQRHSGASLTTIGRVARFLKDEPYQGYRSILKKLNSQKVEA